MRRLLAWWSGCDSTEPCRSRRTHRRHLRVIEKLNRYYEEWHR